MITSVITSPSDQGVKPIPKRELLRILKRRGLSLRRLAAAIGTSDTTVIRVVNRDMKSAPCWRKIHAFLAENGESAA